MKHKVVLGSFFGDEGKGATVQWLCKKAIEENKKPIVVRFSGGAQCGHRVIHNSIEHVCSSYGSGVLLNVPTYLDENVYIDPISIMNECKEIYSKTGFMPTLYINGFCRVTTPFDIYSNRQNKETLSHGSCGEGIFATFKRYNSKEALHSFYLRGYLRDILGREQYYIEEVAKYYKMDNSIVKELNAIKEFKASIEWLKENTTIIYAPVYYSKDLPDVITRNHLLYPYDVVIWEGSQGMLLDMDCGFMPHCTPSKTGLNGIPSKYLDNAEVFLVMRSYLTRHGNGFTPIGEDTIEYNYTNLEEPTNNDTGYQGVFKRGVFDTLLLKRLFDRHHLDNYKWHHNLKYNIVMNHLDCIKDKFHYTKDEKEIVALKCIPQEEMASGIKIVLKETVPFDNFYVGYEQSELSLV